MSPAAKAGTPKVDARCSWCEGNDELTRYHDAEWGMPVIDDQRLLEKLCLEGFQSGLSWLTVLRKRARFREVFADFDPRAMAAMGEADVQRLLGDAGIIRHRGKIEAALTNARALVRLWDEHGPSALARLAWGFEPAPAARPARVTREVIVAMPQTAESKALSKELKRRGFAFVGPTTCYAFMQAMGLVNDHEDGCARRAVVERARAALARPTRLRADG